MSLSVAILAGGFGTRLGSVTRTVPKSLVDVAGEPFVLRQLRYLRGQGIENVTLCVGHLGAQIEALVGDGQRMGLSVRYSWDGPEQQGTGGALRQALDLLEDPFFAFYGDSYLPIDFRAVESAFVSSGAPALMTVMRNRDQWDRSNAIFREGWVVEYDKRRPRVEMEYIDYGLGVLSKSVVQDYPHSPPFDLGDLYRDLARAGHLAAYEVNTRFYEIGSHAGLRETTEYFMQSDEP